MDCAEAHIAAFTYTQRYTERSTHQLDTQWQKAREKEHQQEEAERQQLRAEDEELRNRMLKMERQGWLRTGG